jgi:hypothetical protein
MNLLIRTDRCKELFLEWEKLAGWHEAVLYQRAVTDEIRSLIESPAMDPERLLKVATAAVESSRQFKQALDNYDGESVKQAAVQYAAEELGLPWEWLPKQLVVYWTESLGAWSTGQLLDINLYHPTPEPNFPITPYNFTPLPNETPKERIARIRKETARYVAEQKKLEEQFRPKKGWPGVQKVIVRDVGWFFRFKVNGETIPQIADFDGNGKRRKKAKDERYMRKRIKEAERLLGLGR